MRTLMFLIFQVKKVENWPARFKVAKNIEIQVLGYTYRKLFLKNGNDYLCIFLLEKIFPFGKSKSMYQKPSSYFLFISLVGSKRDGKENTSWNLTFEPLLQNLNQPFQN